MKRLSLSVLLASTLLISACGGDSQEALDKEGAVGTASQIDAITNEYHEKMKAVSAPEPAPEPAVIPMDPSVGDVSVHDLKSAQGNVIGGAEHIHAITAEYHEKMKAAQ